MIAHAPAEVKTKKKTAMTSTLARNKNTGVSDATLRAKELLRIKSQTNECNKHARNFQKMYVRSRASEAKILNLSNRSVKNTSVFLLIIGTFQLMFI